MQTAVNGGSELLIFVRPERIHSPDLSICASPRRHGDPGRARVFHVAGAERHANTGDRTYLVLANRM